MSDSMGTFNKEHRQKRQIFYQDLIERADIIEKFYRQDGQKKVELTDKIDSTWVQTDKIDSKDWLK